MTIPQGITREHIISAINEVKNNGVPNHRHSMRYILVYEGETYPPKYIVGLANKYANGYELDRKDHHSGAETNQFLGSLGFEIIKKRTPDNGLLPGELLENNTYVEGAKKSILVNAYERNPVAREACLKHHGYNCAVCEINFEDVYGEIGEGFTHVHHLKPLHELKEEYEVDPVNDLRPVCPNCHAMLHKKEPVYTIDELKAIKRKMAKR
ncbi:HNH endonuclease [Paenibacillus sp. FSL E2-0190]|uniref:HNH endonuclease n=1 Tax=Paenibacillus sp. FSL E2-0190 TaxID=2954504 RepID=UPI0030EB2924